MRLKHKLLYFCLPLISVVNEPKNRHVPGYVYWIHNTLLISTARVFSRVPIFMCKKVTRLTFLIQPVLINLQHLEFMLNKTPRIKILKIPGNAHYRKQNIVIFLTLNTVNGAVKQHFISNYYWKYLLVQ